MTTVYLNGQPLTGVKSIDVIHVDEAINMSAEAFKSLGEVIPQATQTLTLNTSYWQLLWLADRVEPQNKKKAKQIRNAAERRNPLRIMGLL